MARDICPTSRASCPDGLHRGDDTSQGIPVIDLLCASRSYESGNLSIDGFHPNDNGYSILASMMVSAITAPTYPAPQASCPQMNVAAKV
ncbi:MAG: hypothetical protein DLM53_06475 [Candidatus Eremiobacter antarcticus]|nr:SGNH/GDSL hydrolase family protein [Candidatus Eremiobacteraeota bacterium]PZR62121.1 MAG: hypothetical protein DLM53_06475 [Candidatus Eremiobacter sp. RRmetagenome_bin22]